MTGTSEIRRAAVSMRKYVRPVCRLPLALAAAALMTAPAVTAWPSIPDSDPAGLFSGQQIPSSPAVADLCLPLLKSIHTDTPNAATRRAQRTAGTAAARLSFVGLLFGAHYALGPLENTAPDTGAPGERPDYRAAALLDGERHAQAVALYRECSRNQFLGEAR